MRWNGMKKKGNHKALISKELFDTCQYVAARHRMFLVRERKYNFLFRGLIFCQEHNRRLVAEWHPIKSKKRNNKIAYYHCPERGGCKGSWVEKEKLEKYVANRFKRFQFTEEFIALVTQKVREALEESRKTIKSEAQGLLNQKTGLEIKRNKLEDRLLDETIDRETFKRKHTEIQAQISAINTQIDTLERKRNIDVDLVEEVLALSRNIYQTYLDAPDFLKRHHIRFFFEKLYVKDRHIVKVVPSRLFKVLLEEQKVILRSPWLRG